VVAKDQLILACAAQNGGVHDDAMCADTNGAAFGHDYRAEPD
jgi:hypothetical protein